MTLSPKAEAAFQELVAIIKKEKMLNPGRDERQNTQSNGKEKQF